MSSELLTLHAAVADAAVQQALEDVRMTAAVRLGRRVLGPGSPGQLVHYIGEVVLVDQRLVSQFLGGHENDYDPKPASGGRNAAPCSGAGPVGWWGWRAGARRYAGSGFANTKPACACGWRTSSSTPSIIR